MGTTALNPGQETTVDLTLMMHPGMDGPHLFRVTVPVKRANGQEAGLRLYVRADFR